MHEQSAVHLADGYYRASGGRCWRSLASGPADEHGHRHGDRLRRLVRGRPASPDRRTRTCAGTACSRRSSGATSRTTRASSSRSSRSGGSRRGSTSCRSCSTGRGTRCVSGRPGPVLLDLPMDVQAEASRRRACATLPPVTHGPRPAAADDRASGRRCCAGAQRPVIVAGGGVIFAMRAASCTALAERLGAPVVTTWKGKGRNRRDAHARRAWTIGDTASTSGNALASSADVILAVGCRFTDWSASSWRAGRHVRDPADPAHPDRHRPREIGKNYPVEVGLVGDARAGSRDLLDALGPGEPTTATARRLRPRELRLEASRASSSPGRRRRPMTRRARSARSRPPRVPTRSS